MLTIANIRHNWDKSFSFDILLDHSPCAKVTVGVYKDDYDILLDAITLFSDGSGFKRINYVAISRMPNPTDVALTAAIKNSLGELIVLVMHKVSYKFDSYFDINIIWRELGIA